MPSNSDKTRLIRRALNITSQDWSRLGQEKSKETLDDITECITSLILVRLIALTTAQSSDLFSDLSTTTICNTLIEKTNDDGIFFCWPQNVNDTVIEELRCYVKAILNGYNNVKYHNFEHGYHVVVSCNKLMDLILQSRALSSSEQQRHRTHTTATSSRHLRFDEDPLMHLALLFAALIHDVEHQGVPNKQLVIENHPLAIQYNDQSVAEQRSLTIGFTELLKQDYDNLREVMLPFTLDGGGGCYRRFREAVTSLVLATDIATPERNDIVKQKWKKVFVDSKKQRPLRDNKRQLLKTSSTCSGRSLLPPPKDHPTPLRGKRTSFVEKKPQMPIAPELDFLQESWVELGATPSTHFPKKSTQSSLHDSMAFWWFCEDEAGDDDSDCFEGSHESFASMSGRSSSFDNQHYDEDAAAAAAGLDGSLHMSQGSSWLQDTDIPLKPSNSGSLSDDFYPSSSSQSLYCSVSTISESGDLQHLLSPSKVCRPKRSLSQSSKFSLFSPRKDGPSYSKTSSEDGPEVTKQPRGSLLSKVASFKRRGSRAGPNSNIQASFEDNTESFAFNQDDVSESTLTTAMSASTKMQFEESDTLSFFTAVEQPAVDLPPEKSETESLPVQGEETGLASVAVAEKTEQTIPIAEEKGNDDRKEQQEETEIDEQIFTISLMEHILLVADVSHNMQGYDTMIKFSHRLSKEIQHSITAGRSGGIMDDPLSDWYTNQSGFIHGYIKPLAERLEKTGCLPSSLNNHDVENDLDDGSKETLTGIIDSNLERWQEQGHDVIIEWRRLREKADKKAAEKKAKKKLLQSSSSSNNNKKSRSSDGKKHRKSKSTTKKSKKKRTSSTTDAPGSKLDFSYEPKNESTKKIHQDVLEEQVLAPFGRILFQATDSVVETTN